MTRACLAGLLSTVFLWACGLPTKRAHDGATPADAELDAAFRRETHRGAVLGGLYNCNDLDVVPAGLPNATTLVSMVQGLVDVEVLQIWAGGEITVNSLSGPPENCTHVPVSVSVMDVNGDGRKDLVVLDLCRNWVALDDGAGGYSVQHLDDFASGMSSAIVSVSASSTDGTELLVAGTYTWARADALPSPLLDSGSLMNYLELPSSQSLRVPVSSPFLEVPGQEGRVDQLILQGQNVMAVSDLTRLDSGVSISQPRILPLGAVEPPYLEPFDGLDHLQLLRMAGCSDAALAIGVFRQNAGRPSRQLQLVTLSTAEYLTHEIETPFSISAFGLATAATGRTFVGMIGKDVQGDVFGLAEVLGCGNVKSIGSWPTTFDWRTPDAPAFLDLGPTVPKTDGIRLLGLMDIRGVRERLSFTNYDGYTVRTWSVFLDDIDSRVAVPVVQTTTIHEERKDLAYVD